VNDDESLLEKPSPFSVWQLFCYGFLSMPIALASFSLALYLPTYYAVDLGLGLALVGSIIVVGRIFDVMTDPVVGYYSDATRSRWGPRKPWMLIGVMGFALAIWLLFDPSQSANIVYLLGVILFYFLFYTILDVPYSSTGLEVSSILHERSILASSKSIFQVLGATIGAALPIAFAYSMAQTLNALFWIVLISLFAGLFLFFRFVPLSPVVERTPRKRVWEAFKIIRGNEAYRTLILAFFVVQTANAFIAALSVLFIDRLLESAPYTGLFLGILTISSALFLPIWVQLSKHAGKEKTWRIAIGVAIGALLIVPFLNPDQLWLSCLFFAVLGGTFGCDAIMPTSILADIVHANEQAGKGRLAAMFLAFKNSVSKLSFVVPMGIAFPILGWVEFEKKGNLTSTQNWIFIGFYALVPVMLRICALIIIEFARRQQRNLERTE